MKFAVKEMVKLIFHITANPDTFIHIKCIVGEKYNERMSNDD